MEVESSCAVGNQCCTVWYHSSRAESQAIRSVTVGAPWGVLRDIPQPGTSPFIQGNRPPRVVVSIEISLRARTSAVSAHAAPTMTLRCAPRRDDNQATIGCVTFQKYATAMLT